MTTKEFNGQKYERGDYLGIPDVSNILGTLEHYSGNIYSSDAYDQLNDKLQISDSTLREEEFNDGIHVFMRRARNMVRLKSDFDNGRVSEAEKEDFKNSKNWWSNAVYDWALSGWVYDPFGIDLLTASIERDAQDESILDAHSKVEVQCFVGAENILLQRLVEIPNENYIWHKAPEPKKVLQE